MSCLIVAIAAVLLRLTMFFIWLFTNWFAQAYATWIWPLLGFLFMPYTTLAYMAAMLRNNRQLSGWWLALLILGVVIDVGCSGGGAARRSRK